MTLLEDASIRELEEALAERRALYALEVIPINDPDQAWEYFARRLSRKEAIEIGNAVTLTIKNLKMRILTDDPGEDLVAIGSWGFQDESWRDI